MIRLAILFSILTFVGFHKLPIWRAQFTQTFFDRCLEITPHVHHENEIRSLVCGSSLQTPRDGARQTPRDGASVIAAWRNLGLIHILVVSGGHLSVLAMLISYVGGLIFKNRRQKFALHILIAIALLLFCLSNRLQPPVLRALVEWTFRKPLARRGWRSSEVAFMSTWFALPFSSSIYDLLSLALSFFASVTVEQTARHLHRRRWLQAIALQLAVWWILLPLLFTMGVPHPLTSMTNIVLAPLLGATIIPFAMLTWASGLMPAWSSNSNDPIWFGYAFDSVWEKLNIGISWLAQALPQASPGIAGVKPLIFGFESTTALLVAILYATAALLLRSKREQRRAGLARSGVLPWSIVLVGFAIALVVHTRL